MCVINVCQGHLPLNADRLTEIAILRWLLMCFPIQQHSAMWIEWRVKFKPETANIGDFWIRLLRRKIDWFDTSSVFFECSFTNSCNFDFSTEIYEILGNLSEKFCEWEKHINLSIWIMNEDWKMILNNGFLLFIISTNWLSIIEFLSMPFNAFRLSIGITWTKVFGLQSELEFLNVELWKLFLLFLCRFFAHRNL